MSSRPSVILGTPCYGGLVTHVYLHSLVKLMVYASARNIGVGLFTAAHDSLVPRARNTILARLLDTPTATHLMFVDADTGFEPEQFARLLAFDEDFVAGMYPIKNIDWAKAAGRKSEGDVAVEPLQESGLHYVGVPLPAAEREVRDGFVTAEYAGTGFMLIRRAVAERMASAFPETKYRGMHTFPQPAQVSENFYNLFDCIVEPKTRVYLSEDYTFCHRWRQIGGKIWLDTKSRLKHVGSYEFQGAPQVDLAT